MEEIHLATTDKSEKSIPFELKNKVYSKGIKFIPQYNDLNHAFFVRITNCLINNYIVVDRSTFSDCSVNIILVNCKSDASKGQIIINGLNSQDSFKITNSILNGINITSNKIKYFEIVNTLYKRSTISIRESHIRLVNTIGLTQLSNCTNSVINVSYSVIEDHLSDYIDQLFNIIHNEKMSIEYVAMGRNFDFNVEASDSLYSSKDPIASMLADYIKTNGLHFFFSSESIGEGSFDVFIKNIYIKSIGFNENGHFGNVVISDSYLNAFKTHQCYIENLNFENIDCFSKDPKFSISKVKFGAIKFVDANLTGFKLNLNLKDFDKVSFYNTAFPIKIHTYVDEDVEEKININYFDKQAEVYAQIIKKLESSNNGYTSKLLKAELHNILAKSGKVRDEDKWILQLNAYTNRHGLSYWRPFKLLFIFNISAWIIINLVRIVDVETYCRCAICFSNYDCNIFSSNTLASIFVLANPIHRDEQLFSLLNVQESNIVWIYYAIAYISRVVNAFLIYQFVQAFRKFGRRMN